MPTRGTGPAIFLGAQSSLERHILAWGTPAVIWGGHDPEMPPRGAGLA